MLGQKVQKQQVCPFSYVLGAFRPSHKKNSFCHRISEFLKSNKSLCFHGNLGLLTMPRRRTESAKATSLSVFLYTWGFSSFSQEEFVKSSHLRIPQKQQVLVFSWQLGAFDNAETQGRKCKSNKSLCFHSNLGLLPLRDAGAESTKATSLAVFI